jgi:formamidopyrimidine-DNA glycosylase
MPELGDVERFRRVAAAFDGATIVRIDVLDAGVIRNTSAERFVACLRGKRIGPATRRGKWLILAVDDRSVLFHFGMTGALVRGNGDELRADDRVVFDTDVGEFRYRDLRKLRGIHLAADTDEMIQILGDIDASGISAADLRRRLHSQRGSIKAGLIDQTRVAGIGNFVSDEILWRAHIHPSTRTHTLNDDEWVRLHRALTAVVRATSRAGHTPRGPRWLTGARWAQHARCPACASELQRSVVAGRSSVWCPTCQGLPRA